jgi:hypothetical protein
MNKKVTIKLQISLPYTDRLHHLLERRGFWLAENVAKAIKKMIDPHDELGREYLPEIEVLEISGWPS